MDSQLEKDGRMMDLIDDEWRSDKLPFEDIDVPVLELPEPEQENGNSTETLREIDQKWTDLGLQALQESLPVSKP